MKSSMKQVLVLTLVASWLVCRTGSGDTYNFYFSKPKKGSPTKNAANTQKDADDDAEENPAPEAKPAETAPAPAGIVIHNHNGTSEPPRIVKPQNGPSYPIGVTPPTPAPLPPSEKPEPQTAPSGAVNVETVAPVAIASPRKSRWRMSFGATYFGRREYNEKWWNYGSSSTSYYTSGDYTLSGTSTGGMLSFAYTPSPVFALNLMFGADQMSTYGHKKMLYTLGAEAELYPFNGGLTERPPIDLALVGGVTTGLLADGRLGALHLGSRLTLNFSSTFGLTAVARLGTDFTMGEVGFITRL